MACALHCATVWQCQQVDAVVQPTVAKEGNIILLLLLLQALLSLRAMQGRSLHQAGGSSSHTAWQQKQTTGTLDCFWVLPNDLHICIACDSGFF
jgi:hypothetical protein